MPPTGQRLVDYLEPSLSNGWIAQMGEGFYIDQKVSGSSPSPLNVFFAFHKFPFLQYFRDVTLWTTKCEEKNHLWYCGGILSIHMADLLTDVTQQALYVLGFSSQTHKAYNNGYVLTIKRYGKKCN